MRSVRGYGYGELGAARRFLETALEARVPLKNFGLPGTAYAFTEYGTDLSSARGLEVRIMYNRILAWHVAWHGMACCLAWHHSLSGSALAQGAAVI